MFSLLCLSCFTFRKNSVYIIHHILSTSLEELYRKYFIYCFYEILLSTVKSHLNYKE